MKSKILPLIAASFGLICAAQLSQIASARDDAKSISKPSASNPQDNGSDAMPIDKKDVGIDDSQACLTGIMAEEILKKKSALDKRELELDKRNVGLKALSARLDQELTTIKQLKSEIETVTQNQKAIADSDLTHLVQMYSTMKPKNAAEIFDNMPAAFAAGFLREIDGARAGMIMSLMDTKKSFEISLIIANNNAKWR